METNDKTEREGGERVSNESMLSARLDYYDYYDDYFFMGFCFYFLLILFYSIVFDLVGFSGIVGY